MDSEETGKKLLRNGRLRYRVTLIPLNKISAHVTPESKKQIAKDLVGKENVTHALSLIQYGEDVKPAIHFAFGNTLICQGKFFLFCVWWSSENLFFLLNGKNLKIYYWLKMIKFLLLKGLNGKNQRYIKKKNLINSFYYWMRLSRKCSFNAKIEVFLIIEWIENGDSYQNLNFYYWMDWLKMQSQYSNWSSLTSNFILSSINEKTAFFCYFLPKNLLFMSFLSDMDSAKKVTFHNQIRTRSVTLEGDMFDPSGTLTGIFIFNFHKITVFYQIKAARNFEQWR